MRKKRDSLQGQASTLRGGENEMRVFSAIAKAQLTLPELLSMKIVSRPVLYEHLGNLLKAGFIFKDTVKSHETNNPERVGKIVYKPTGSLIEQFTRNFVEMRMKTSDLLEFDEKTKRKLEEHYEAIAKIWSEYLKAQAQTFEEILHDKGMKEDAERE